MTTTLTLAAADPQPTAPATPAAPEWFAFALPGDDGGASFTDFSGLNARPAGAAGFVQVREGHFYVGTQRLRLWGVNFVFGANYPEHADAERAAGHLAKLGINAVRVHHHDTFTAPGGLWLAPKDGKRELDPAQMERQDYLLDQLARHGIYTNLNLHVSRTFTEAEGFVSKDLPSEFHYDKFLLYFDPQMRARFKDFCRAYLLHTNPYRQLRRVDDPSIALIEITNENRFSVEGLRTATQLPEPYRSTFLSQWRAWLAAHYASDDKLRQAWSPPTAGGPPTVLADGSALAQALGAWRLNVGQGKVEPQYGQPGPQPDRPALRLHLAQPCGQVWEQELMRTGLTLVKGDLYTVHGWVRADKARRLYVDVSNSGPDNWRPLGYSATLNLTPDWQEIRTVFVAPEDSAGNARLCFKYGGDANDLYLADFSLLHGGQFQPLTPAQTLAAGTLPWPASGFSLAAQADAQRFLVDTEEAFIRDLTQFLRRDLGVKVPITNSQLGYEPPAVIANTCDYADAHAYWQHPNFPHRAWDPADWNLANTPMEAAPGKDSLSHVATTRLLDRPFTLSEWNIPAPHDFAASVVPFAATFAALQDWDGVFFFDYHGSNGKWTDQGPDTFFSLRGHPVKQALLGVGANLFCRADLAPLTAVAAGTLTQPPPTMLAFSHRLGLDPTLAAATLPSAPADRTHLAAPDARAVWDISDPAHAAVLVNAPATRLVYGLVGGQTYTLGDLTLAVGPCDRDYAVIALSSRDGKPLAQSKHLLLVALGRAENPGMGWNATRTSVGNQWGSHPALCNGITATLTTQFPLKAIYPLDPTGARLPATVPPIPLTHPTPTTTRIQLSPAAKTLWYELEAE